MNSTVVGAVVASASAIGFAVSAAAQHKTAASLPETGRSNLALLGHAVRNPWWCAAMALSTVALLLHGVAFTLAPIAIVQPLMMLAVVLAVPLRAIVDGHLPPRHQVVHVALTAIGLCTFLIAVDPSAGTDGARPGTGTALVVIAVCALGWSMARWSPTSGRQVSGLLLGGSAGMLYAATAVGLFEVANTLARDGAARLATHWGTWLWLAAGVLAIGVNQKAYQRASLHLVYPTINVVNAGTSIALGILIFQQIPAHGGAAVATQVLGLLIAVSGLCLATRAPETASGPTVHDRGEPVPPIAGFEHGKDVRSGSDPVYEEARS